ncbi:MAG: cysteine--tRNA ligase, partial [Pirellulaceae bacterium]
VYDFAHIGNFRTFLFGDLLRRFLEFAGYDVHHVMNITDVGHMTDDADEGEDKMKVAMQKLKEDKKSYRVPEGAIENPDDPYQIAGFFTNAFIDDSRRLGYKVTFEDPATCMPKATDNIDGMLEMIQKLIDRGHAYVADDGVVYFSVESFSDYGKLSGNTLDHLKSGAGGRVSDEHQSLKRHPADFMLWKPDDHHIMKWDSAWGTGYPGWHIECSVMASKLLGSDVIDIHTGGEDLKFSHHECEIAQSRGATGESSFANYWIHARFLFVEGGKMSKSSGTFYTVRDVMEGNFKKGADTDELWGKTVDPAVIRYELIKSHYRDTLNFTAKGIEDSAKVVRRLIEFRNKLEQQTGGEAAEVDLNHPILKAFGEALADDMNISKAMSVVMPWIAQTPDDPREALGVFKKINSVISVAPINEGIEGAEAMSDSADADLDAQLAQLCKEMDEARAAKDFERSDAIRDQIREMGFETRQTPDGTVIQKELA